MDWNNINRDRDTSGLGPIEYDQSKVPVLIRKHADNVRTKTYGQEVREAQARNAEVAGLIASEAVDISNETKGRQDTVETQFNSIQQELTDKDPISAPEIIAAREGKDTLNDRLASDRKRIELTPDDFKGTDLEKLQQTVDYAIDKNITIITLNRSYDITGGSIMMPTAKWWGRLTFIGGELIKNDVGYMIDRNADNRDCHSPQFKDTKIVTEVDNVYVFNGDKMIRQQLESVKFTRVGLVKTSGYLQTLRLHMCETTELGCDFINAKMAFDFEISHHRGESSATSYKFIHIQTNQTNDISYFGLRITNSLIEGYTNTTPIVLGTGYGFLFDGVYFEANKTSIKFVKGVGTARISGKLSNIVFGRTTSDYDIEFDGISEDLPFLEIENVTSNVPTGKYLTNLTKVHKDIKGLNLYSGGSIAPASFRVVKSNTVKVEQQTLGEVGARFIFTIPTNIIGNISTSYSLRYLLDIGFNVGNSSLYKGHLTGIVSIDGYWDVNMQQVRASLTVTVLSHKHTGGKTYGDDNDPVSFDYYFLDTNLKSTDPYKTKPSLTISLPNIKYNTNNSARLIPLNMLSFDQYIDLN